MEQWRKIVNNEHIEVSTLGNVKVFPGYKISRKIWKSEGGNTVQIIVHRKNEYYRFMLHYEVIKFKIPDYAAKKMIWLNGDRSDCRLENLSDARKSAYFKHSTHLLKLESIKNASISPDEPLCKIMIYKHEFKALMEFNEKSINEIKNLKKENEQLKRKLGIELERYL